MNSVAKVQIVRKMTPADIAHYDGAEWITITAQLRKIEGNARPYFSLTGDISKGCRDIACGCLHDEILGAAPELAPIAALHLSDDTGTPMHAEANGWYQLAGALGGMGERYHAGNGKRQHWKPGRVFDGYRESTPDECLESFAKHCRISMDDARAIAERVKAAPSPREAWRAACASMSERWQREADAGLALLRSLGA